MTRLSFFAGGNPLEKGRSRAPFRILLAVASIWLLCGLSFPKAHLRQPEPLPVPVYRFVDARDPKLARSANESLIITNCAYASVRIGQRDIDPDLALLLHGMLTSRFGDRLAGREVKLTAFSLHINNAAALRGATAGMYRGVIAGLMNDTRKVGCSGDDTRGGYVMGEVQDGASPFIVAVHVSIDGKSYRGRSIAAALGRMQALPGTPAADGDDPGALSPRDEIYQRGIDEALKRLGDAIEVGLSTPSIKADIPAGSSLPASSGNSGSKPASESPRPVPPPVH